MGEIWSALAPWGGGHSVGVTEMWDGWRRERGKERDASSTFNCSIYHIIMEPFPMTLTYMLYQHEVSEVMEKNGDSTKGDLFLSSVTAFFSEQSGSMRPHLSFSLFLSPYFVSPLRLRQGTVSWSFRYAAIQ